MDMERLIPGERGRSLVEAMLDAIERVYEENVARYDPDGIGDDTTVFGFTVSRNLRHVLEVAVKDIPGVKARRAHNTFFLVVDGQFEIYFCKAPPEAATVHAVSFEDSYVRSRITERNGDHVQLRLDIENETTTAVLEYTPAPYAVVVHFGDPEDGFSYARVGAPYRLKSGEFAWEWELPLQRDENDGTSDTVVRRNPNADTGGFGLRLRPVASEGEA
jgi:hypothetical protein